MMATTPRRLARALDPGLSIAKEAAKALPSRKRSPQWKSTFIVGYWRQPLFILIH